LFGAAREIRTPDPIITNDVLYQLSYCGPVGQRRGLRRPSNGAAVYATSPRLGNTPDPQRQAVARLGTWAEVA
jgi:hypothetical protein